MSSKPKKITKLLKTHQYIGAVKFLLFGVLTKIAKVEVRIPFIRDRREESSEVSWESLQG